LPNGFLIDLPTTDIFDYTTSMLTWLPLSSDAELVVRLHAKLKRLSPQMPLEDLPIREIDLLETPMF
jgi:hypothetical protein